MVICGKYRSADHLSYPTLLADCEYVKKSALTPSWHSFQIQQLFPRSIGHVKCHGIEAFATSIATINLLNLFLVFTEFFAIQKARIRAYHQPRTTLILWNEFSLDRSIASPYRSKTAVVQDSISVHASTRSRNDSLRIHRIDTLGNNIIVRSLLTFSRQCKSLKLHSICTAFFFTSSLNSGAYISIYWVTAKLTLSAALLVLL